MMNGLMLLNRLLIAKFLVLLLCAWTVPSMPEDITNSAIGDTVSCTYQVSRDPVESSVFNKAEAPLNCHRWGLKWGFYQPDGTRSLASVRNMSPPFENQIVSQEVEWQLVLWAIDNNENGNPRLPTIKELVRIFEYDPDLKSRSGVPNTDEVFQAWFQVNSTSSTPLDGYLISSTYRHINGTAEVRGEMRDPHHYAERVLNGDRFNPNIKYKRIRILGIEIGTGKVVAFNRRLELCENLTESAECSPTSSQREVYAFTVADL